jgi:protein-tyrosine phosphatase
VTAVSFGSAEPYRREVPPDFGLYLDGRWQPPWPHEFLDWPDFSVPEDAELVVTALEALRQRARHGERVEIGCYGGHGRTGTALAVLALLCGHQPDQAVGWVRATYCERAVENDEQEAFVQALRAAPGTVGREPS